GPAGLTSPDVTPNGAARRVRRGTIPVVTALSGSHVLVTGGSSGIGLAVAGRVLARGARVSIVARDEPRLDSARAGLEQLAGDPERVASASADVSDAPALRAGIGRVVDRLGPVDVLVTAAGYAHPGRFVD